MNTISISNVTKKYPGITALDAISFEVKKGSIHGFLGPNGAGKSTTMNIITGLIPPSSGTVKVFGLDVKSDLSEVKKLIGFLPENPPLYMNMTVENYLKFVARIHKVKPSLKHISHIMDKCGLLEVKKRLVGHLSKGFKQRVGIAQALVYNPKIIILDEPTVGLDPNSISEIRELILSLQEEHTILLSTHQLHEASLMCSDITIINNGKVVESGPVEKVREKFQTNQVISFEVEKWDDNLTKKIMTKYDCKKIDVSKKDNRFDLRFYSSSKDDLRSSVSKFLISNDCSLLSFAEEKLDLEDIFIKALEDK